MYYAGRVAPHVVIDWQHEARGQLSQRGACAGKGWRVWQEAQRAHQIIKLFGHQLGITAPLCLGQRHV